MAEEDRATLGAAADPAAAADQAQQAPPDPTTETAAPPPDGGQGPAEAEKVFLNQLTPNKGVMDEDQRRHFTPAQKAIINAVFEFQLSLFREVFSTAEVLEDPQGNGYITWPEEEIAEQQIDRILEQSETDNAKKKAIIEKFNLTAPESTSIFDIFREFVPVQDAEEELKNITKAALLQTMKETAEAAEAAKAKESPPHLDSKPAQKHKMPNDPLTNALAGRYNPKTGEIEKVINAGAFDLPIGKDMTAYTQVDMKGLNIDEGGDEFGPFEESVLNAICSLYEAGNNAITAKMVCRHLRNAFNSEYIEPEFEQRVKNSIEKLRRIHAKSDFSELLRKKGKDIDGNQIIVKAYDDFLLTARIGIVEAGGRTTECYFLPIEPLPLTVSKQTHQLITVGVKVLDIRRVEANGILGKPLKVTSRRRQIVEYMTRRVEVLKNDRKNKRNKQNDIIAFDTLYRENGANDSYTEVGTIKDEKGEIVQRGKKQASQKKYQHDIRNHVFEVLDYWKAIGYIAGYEIIYDRRKMHGVRIILAEDNAG